MKVRVLLIFWSLSLDCFAVTSSQEGDRNISKTCAFIFHHSIQHDEASSYAVYKKVTLCGKKAPS